MYNCWLVVVVVVGAAGAGVRWKSKAKTHSGLAVGAN